MIVTKIQLPPSKPHHTLVPRPQIWHTLNTANRSRLILISAPAGSGKTTTISQWLHHHQIPAAWISLDETDNEASRFWQQIVAACRTACPEINFDTKNDFQNSAPHDLKDIRGDLVNHLAKNQNPFYMVLDDYHLISTSAIHKSLTRFIDLLPENAHIILTTRVDPPLPLPRLRVRGELTELRIQDLRFTNDETSLFFHQVMKLKLSPEDVTTLADKTEGWIAGLQLAALALKANGSHASPAQHHQFVQAFAGNHYHVADYLLEEVLHQQTTDCQTFLLQTSILEWLSAPLCDAILNRHDSFIQLEQIEKANLFLQPLDNQHERYRYHHLFTDLLQARLAQTDTANIIPELHLRAAQWFENNGHEVEALNHYLRAKEFKAAEPLFWHLANPALLRGELQTVSSWLTQIPVEAQKKHLVFAHFNAWILLLSGTGLEQVESWVHISEQFTPPEVSADLYEQVQINTLAMRSLLMSYRGEFENVVKYAQPALERMPEDNHAKRCIVTLMVGDSYRWDGDHDKATHYYEDSIKTSAQAQNYNAMLQGYRALISIAFSRGRLDLVDAYISRATFTLAQEKPAQWLPALGPIFTAKSLVAYERNNLAEARHEWQNGRSYCEELSQTASLNGSYMCGAKIHQAYGELETAQDLLNTTKQLLPQNLHPFSWIVLERIQVIQWEQTNDLTSMQHWLKQQSVPSRYKAYAKNYLQTTCARALVALAKTDPGSHAKTQALLNQLAETAQENGWLGDLLTLLLLQAKLYAYDEAAKEAQSSLTDALNIGEPQGYIRSFLDEGLGIRDLLQKRKQKGPYVRKLLAAFKLAANSDEIVLTDPLSNRELEVLHLISEGYVNQEIAKMLSIAVSTVKTHINHIFSKLGVKTRAQAIAQSRKLNLL